MGGAGGVLSETRTSAAAHMASSGEEREVGVDGGAGGSEDEVAAVVESSQVASGIFSCHESIEEPVLSDSSSGM
jgi:hypothetical protein